jgi:hypothetical protein
MPLWYGYALCLVPMLCAYAYAHTLPMLIPMLMLYALCSSFMLHILVPIHMPIPMFYAYAYALCSSSMPMV